MQGMSDCVQGGAAAGKRAAIDERPRLAAEEERGHAVAEPAPVVD